MEQDGSDPRKIFSYDDLVDAAARKGVRSTEGYDRAVRQDPNMPVLPHVEFPDEWARHGDWPGFLKKVAARMRLPLRTPGRRFAAPYVPSALKVGDPDATGPMPYVRATIEDGYDD